MKKKNVRFQSAGRHELSDEYDLLGPHFAVLPVLVETHDVGMLQLLEHLGLLDETLSLRFAKLAILYRCRCLHNTFS